MISFSRPDSFPDVFTVRFIRGGLLKMFYGCDGSATDRKMGGGFVENILISASILWNGKKFRRFYPPAYDLLFLDSGGFSFFYKSGDYPFTIKQYVELAEKLNANFVAIMDYPCEPDVVRTNGLNTNIQRIEKTISNAKKCLEHEELNWVMVVQGYTMNEYQYCCDRIKEEDLLTPLMAIGSLCVRKKIDEARRIISLVRRNFPSVRLHGFGIDLRFLKDIKIRGMLWSADTQAWKWNNRSFGLNHKGYMPKCERDKLENFHAYKSKVDALCCRKYIDLLSMECDRR
jgi:tRNA-guanine family transglycosylase